MSRAGSSTGTGSRLWRNKKDYLGILPFLLLSGIFLIWPTLNVVYGAFFFDEGKFSLAYVTNTIKDDAFKIPFIHSVQISAWSSLAGGLIGGLFAWAVSTGKPDGIARRFVLAAGGVLAQFGGVMLAFAFFATFGFNGFVTSLALKYSDTNFLASPNWLYELFGLGVVYTFFQIPLMFIVFLPAVENLKPQWREASESLGGSSKDYWFRIGFPVLFPSFLGGLLLLFVNAFSAYATAAALISQGTIIAPLSIGNALSSETGGASAPLAKTLSLYMVLVVVIVMAIYTLLRKRVSKWEQ
ncbi:MAG: ABC transporter permease subunit [Acidobacteria bacterium]|nr:ABC transporter permease subunit [Acidobacteriota bacterium]